uniref:Uncharacterized protein n=1 Tax=Romanomermis culicivorax TaxID=13658 RepID=A0A915IPX7_ROMCU
MMMHYFIMLLLFARVYQAQHFSATMKSLSLSLPENITADYGGSDFTLIRQRDVSKNSSGEILRPMADNNKSNGTFDENNGTLSDDDNSSVPMKSVNFFTASPSSSYGPTNVTDDDLMRRAMWLHGESAGSDLTTIVNISNSDQEDDDDEEHHTRDDIGDTKSHDGLDDSHSGNMSEDGYQEAPLHRSARGPIGSGDQSGRSVLTWLIPTVAVAVAVLIFVAVIGVVVKVRKSRRSSSRRADDEDEGSAGEKVTRYPDYLGPPSYEESISVPSLTDGSVSDREIQALQNIESVKRTAKGHSTSNKPQKVAEVEVF